MASNLRSLFQGGVVPFSMSSHLLEEASKVIPNQQLLVNVVSKRCDSSPPASSDV
jgi:hypothetical protein